MPVLSYTRSFFLHRLAVMLDWFCLTASTAIIRRHSCFFFQAEDGIRDLTVTGVQTCALPICDLLQALRFYRDALGLEQIADWSSKDGRVVLLEAGRATLELFDQAQADYVDRIEAGQRVSGPIRLALEVPDSEETAKRLVVAGAEQIAPPVTPPRGRRNA